MGVPSGDRIHSMDALRASTMFLLIPVHAASMLSLNGHEGGWATAIYWLIHLFRLPLFFAMSGFFLALLLTRKGLRETSRNRTLRIAVPLLLGLVTLVPAMVFAAQETGVVLDPEIGVSVGSPFGFTPSFLWFLWYLLIVDAAAVVLYLFCPRLLSASAARFRDLIATPLRGIPLLAVSTALALWTAPTWTAAPATDTFVPEPFVLFYYAPFFALGAALCGRRELVAAVDRNAWRWAACALAATLPAALLFTLHNSATYGSQPIVHGTGLLTYAVATWTSLLALVGLAHRYLNRPRPALRYLADSSYWIYLSHMPAMVLLVALIGATSLGTAPQLALLMAGSLAFSMLTYPLLVRYTVVGRVLNGRRTRSRRGGRLVSKSAPEGVAA